MLPVWPCRLTAGAGVPRAVHDPGKIVTDLAAVALDWDCPADIAVLR
jgi:hypothetical protein